jgi:hypothetical protein
VAATGLCPAGSDRNGAVCFEPQLGHLISSPWFDAMNGLPQYTQVIFVIMDNCIQVGRGPMVALTRKKRKRLTGGVLERWGHRAAGGRRLSFLFAEQSIK